MVVMTVGLRVTCRRTLKCLISALTLLGRGSHGGDQRVAPSGVGVRFGVVGRDLDADAGPGVALVRQGGHLQ